MQINIVASIQSNEPTEAVAISQLDMKGGSLPKDVAKNLGCVQLVDVIRSADRTIRSIREIIVKNQCRSVG